MQPLLSLASTVNNELPAMVGVPERSPLVARVTPAGRGGRVRIGVIGAGAYASSMLLPPLKRNPDAALVAVATTTPLSGENARRHFGFPLVTTDYREVLQDPDVDAVIIATRHSSHARLVAEALRSGKTTYVEKPLAIGADDLALVRRAIEESGR